MDGPNVSFKSELLGLADNGLAPSTTANDGKRAGVQQSL
jgi:hypothetical protein